MSRASVIPDLDLLGVLSDVAVDGLFDLIALATRYPENQVVERCTTKDIHVIAYSLSASCFFP
jgi:hypothetical protein